MRKVRLVLLGLLLAPGALEAKVEVECNSPRRPETYWVVPQRAADAYASNLPLLRRKIPELGYELPMGEPANLPEGRYYLYPVCPNIGIYPQGKLVSSSQTRVTIGCP